MKRFSSREFYFGSWVTLLLLLGGCFTSTHGMDEDVRVQEYRKRYGDIWPPQYVPNTKGWKKLMDHRFEQVQEIEDRHQKYDAWIQVCKNWPLKRIYHVGVDLKCYSFS